MSVLGDDTGTVEEVVAPFGEWEFRVVADHPEETESTIYPDEGTLLTAEQIEPIERGDVAAIGEYWLKRL